MDIRELVTRIQADSAEVLRQLGPAPPSSVLVKAGGNLQAAIDAGGTVQMEAGAVFQGNFVAKKSGLRLLGGAGCQLQGAAGGPALFVPPGSKDIQLYGFSAQTAWDQSVILLGSNDATQPDGPSAPSGLLLSEVQVPKHRGKRAFEVNAGSLLMVNCGCADVYDPAGRDSQGICVLNSPGEIHVSGGSYSAGSENILIGGGGGTQAEKIVPVGLTFDGLSLLRPLLWQTDGVKRIVKTSFEVKTGRKISLTNATIDGCWADGQSGYALTVTPRNGGDIQDVVFDTVTLKNIGAGLNLLGYDDGGYSPQVQRVRLARVICIIPDKKFGIGRFCQIGGEPLGFELEACQFDGPDSIVLSYAGKTWDSATAFHSGYAAIGTKLTGNSFVSRSYGLMLTGAQGAGAYGRFWKEAWPDGVISGNTFSGPTGLNHKPNLPPDNTFSA